MESDVVDIAVDHRVGGCAMHNNGIQRLRRYGYGRGLEIVTTDRFG